MGAPLTAAAVSAMTGLARSEVAEVVAQGERSGAFEQVGPGWFASAPAPRPAVEDEAVEGFRARLVRFAADGGLAGWQDTGAGRALAEELLSWEPAAAWAVAQGELAKDWWAVTLDHPVLGADRRWRRRLAAAGERAARATGNPVRVAAALEHAGRACAALGDPQLAESLLVRAVDTWESVHDEGRVDAVLEDLVRVFSRSGRWARALDAAFVLLGARRRRDQRAAVARALADIAGLMSRAGRTESAVDYWDQALDALSGCEVAPLDLARMLDDAGRAGWRAQRYRPAQDLWHRALALLVDADADHADRVRAQLRLDPGAALPPG
ncbi:hypothetical protein BJP25_21950 [Actinokineospora bangkokensis]|uniref:MalT-like TPR region domain-containing protein n=1 Tax=Actinokineospora bangkokensis TaxID=1193682 RepID=A0A1Q9LL30_9PSEU|nr:hypothetical protein BJP25_21950 [Actinokineospora bangkokensis]